MANNYFQYFNFSLAEFKERSNFVNGVKRVNVTKTAPNVVQQILR